MADQLPNGDGTVGLHSFQFICKYIVFTFAEKDGTGAAHYQPYQPSVVIFAMGVENIVDPAAFRIQVYSRVEVKAY
jgi:hypothetical protein